MEAECVLINSDVKIMTSAAHVEQTAFDQVKSLAGHPAFRGKKMRFMPDIHAGAGCVIGTTAELGTDKGAFIVPNIVGVDIGCGVLVMKLGRINVDFAKFHDFLVSTIPFGFSHNKKVDHEILEWVYVEMLHETKSSDSKRSEGQLAPKSYAEFRKELESAEKEMALQSTLDAVGTLGGGNHFIALNLDPATDDVYLTIHSGSRNFGMLTACYFQEMARCLIKGLPKGEAKPAKTDTKNTKKLRKLHGHLQQYPPEVLELCKSLPPDTEFLAGEHASNYLEKMKLAQVYAALSRRVMAWHLINHLGLKWRKCELIESVHNYIDFTDNIIRKGAISARAGEKVVIPLNMADGVLLGIGRGNADWNNSACHGSGRVLSRSAAKKEVNMDDFRASMSEVWSRCVNTSNIDEAPQCYKLSDYIKKAIEPTVQITHHLKEIYNFKAGVTTQA